jgi:hypothetical protein
MTIDLEGDLRREFDAATPPNSLTFRPEAVVRQGSRIVRRRRIVAGGFAAIAVAVVATGASLLNRPEDSPAPPLPAARTATSGIVKAGAGFSSAGNFEVEFNRDTKVASNVKLFVRSEDGRRREVAAWSTPKPGQKPDATWKSGMVDGYPFTVGLVPGTGADIRLADGASYGIGTEDLKGTGYTVFTVGYKNGNEKEPARPARIARISWSGPTGIVDGTEGEHRLAGQVLALGTAGSVKVVLRPGKGGRITVFGSTESRIGSGSSAGFDLTVANTDSLGVAVVTGRQPIAEKALWKGQNVFTGTDGPPIAAGILPPGASERSQAGSLSQSACPTAG